MRTYFRHTEDSDDMIIVGMEERGSSTMAKASAKIAKAMKYKEFGRAISPKAVLCRYHYLKKEYNSVGIEDYAEYTGGFNNLRDRMAKHMSEPRRGSQHHSQR